MKGLIFSVIFSLFMCYFPTHGSGILKSPVSRSSMWRYFGTASFADKIVANRNDTELNCGGTYTLGNGDLSSKCGLCGDPVGGPRYNEYGQDGVYVIQKPSAVYYEGSAINVTVQVVTKKRGGFFQFYLCESDATTAVTEACFEQHRLPIAGTTETQIQISDFEGDGTFILDLPAGVTCEYCVMRWVWITANEYRCDPTGLCGMGYWDQKTYVNCADVEIISQGTTIPSDFEYPDYQSLYSSIDGNGDQTTPSGLTDIPIVDSTTTSTTPVSTTSGGIPIVTVDPNPGNGTTGAPPNDSNSLIGPVAPVIGGVAAGGLGLPSLGFFAPFLPFAGLAGMGLLRKFGRQGNVPYQQPLMIGPPPGPMTFSAVPVFGGPEYLPSPIPVLHDYNKRPSYTSYGNKKDFNGYGNSGYTDYGTSGYSGYGNSGYVDYGNSNGYGNNGYGNSNYGNLGGYSNNGYSNSNYGNTGGYSNNGYSNSYYGNSGYNSNGYNQNYATYNGNGFKK